VTGVLAECAEGYCIDGTVLFFGDEATLALDATADHDGDGTPETNADELAGLVGTAITVLVEEGASPLVVYAINEVAFPGS
jgi:hypothetical protein